MADTKGGDPLLRRPLYVYDLPPELLYSLSVNHNQDLNSDTLDKVSETPRQPQNHSSENGISSSTSCALCQATFGSVQDQRQHVRSDFHRYNLKMNVKGAPSVDEATFVRLIGDLDESISGSESSESEDELQDDADPKSRVLSNLLQKQVKIPERVVENQHTSNTLREPSKLPIIWLLSSKIEQDLRLGFYRAILSKKEQDDIPGTVVRTIQNKQLQSVWAKNSGSSQKWDVMSSQPPTLHWFLCMIGGGHFAAMIVSLRPELRKATGGLEERHAVVMAHKTFHRYTTRRKQGGSQSANDNAKGNAHSAGSSIRRHNEAALESEIRDILNHWRTMIDSAELLFIRAPGTTNRRTLFGPYDGQVLRSNDDRIRGFPFNTRRATQAELLRSFQELTRIKLTTAPEIKLEKNDRNDSIPNTAHLERASAPKLSKEDEAKILHTSQIHALIRRSKAPALLLYISKNNLSPDFRFFPEGENHHAPTPLHFSASMKSPVSVIALLTKARADPTIKNMLGKTAFEIASDAKTRDAFRVARHQIGDADVDWSIAHVPSPLSQEEVDARNHHEQAAIQADENRRRKADLEQIHIEEEQRSANRIERKAGVGKSLNTLDKTGSEKREEEMRGLTPELRMKLERERRARAVEERMRRMQGAK